MKGHAFADWILAAEAALCLGLAAAARRVLPFAWLGRLAEWPIRAPAVEGAGRRDAGRRVRLAIEAAVRRAPWPALCFEQALAAQTMLRRRGIASTLYYGAGPQGGDAGGSRGLAAHVWVRDGDHDVIGCETAASFAVLASFPPAAKATGL